MAEKMNGVNGVRLRSAVPGRERWEADNLVGQPHLARSVANILRTAPGILYVEVNPSTGRVLVRYTLDPSNVKIAELIHEAVARASSKPQIFPPQDTYSDPALQGGLQDILRPLALVGGAILFSGLLLGTALLSGSALVGVGSLIGTIAVVNHYSRRSHWSQLRSQDLAPAGSRPLTIARHPLERLLKYTRGYRRQLYLASTLSILVKILDVTPPLLLGLAVTILTSGPNSVIALLGITSVSAQLWLVAGFGALIWTIESAFQYFSGILWRNLAQIVQHELRLHAYAHIQGLELGFFEDERTGNLAAILNDDCNQLHLFLDTGASDLVQVITNLIIVGPMFYLLAPRIAWIAVLPIPLIVWGSFFYEDFTATHYAQVRYKGGLVNSRLVSNLSGMSTIKSFSTEQYEIERVRELSQQYRESNQITDALAAAFTPLVRMAVLIGFSGTIALGGNQVRAGAVGAGAYASMITLTQRFLWPLTTLGQIVDDYQRAMAAASRVLDLLDLPLGSNGGNRPLPRAAVKGNIEFKKVNFGYRERTLALRNFSLHVESGKTTAIVGATGAGKTTIVKLLLRFYEIHSGRILIDGIDIRELRLRDLRTAIGLVSQDVFLFDGTVRENIVYGSFGADMESVIAAAELAEVNNFIQALPQKYETIIGERGVKLSGGQRQRICLARAILSNPPILILDEATSSVDNETEAAIQRALERISKGRTIIVIAHRLSTVRHADHIYVLDKDGSIAEQGRHDQLIKNNGIYTGLWRVQSGYALLEDRSYGD